LRLFTRDFNIELHVCKQFRDLFVEIPSMLTVSYTADEHLGLMLAEAYVHDDVAIRVDVEGDVTACIVG
jgi:hypothetical protein